ncbi:MAG: hypothetical protein K9W44_03175 [Candidatus Lokiarchaeota archaeon]|nr:hypothetical protein [Candidatus Harpocratesius repetitus]
MPRKYTPDPNLWEPEPGVFHVKLNDHWYHAPGYNLFPIYWFCGYPLPETLKKDEFGIPAHPFWRYIYYRRRVDPNYPCTNCFTHDNWSDPCPEMFPFHYFFRISDYYYRYGVDLRQYQCNIAGNLFALPFPNPKQIPYDADGYPKPYYWFEKYLIRLRQPNFPIPLYEPNGRPIYDLNGRKYYGRKKWEQSEYLWKRELILFHHALLTKHDAANHISGGDEHTTHYEFKNIDFDKIGNKHRQIYEKMCYRGVSKKIWITERHYPHMQTYKQMCRKAAPHFIPLFTPTLPDLAIAYVSIHRNPSTVLDEKRFPNGFTDENREWLLTCANHTILAYLQANLNHDDPLIIDIILRNKKSLPNSQFSLF